LAVAVCIAVFASGCSKSGPPRSAISGKITYQGKPIDKGEIVFVSADDTGPMASTMIANGAYEIKEEFGPAPGRYIVQIRGFRPTSKKLPPVPYMTEKSQPTALEQFLPPEFNDQSTLTYEVVSGPNAKDFALGS
jgi:hypothetical protein